VSNVEAVPVGAKAVAALAEIAAHEEVDPGDAAELAITAYRDGMRGLRGCVDVLLLLGGFDMEIQDPPIDSRGGATLTLRSGNVSVEIGTVETVPTVADLAEVDKLITRVREFRTGLAAGVPGPVPAHAGVEVGRAG
jgi:hypothetical protein